MCEVLAWTVHAMAVFAPVRAQWPLPSLGADVVDLDVLSQLRRTLSRDFKASERDKGGGGENSLALIASRGEEDAHGTAQLVWQRQRQRQRQRQALLEGSVLRFGTFHVHTQHGSAEMIRSQVPIVSPCQSQQSGSETRTFGVLSVLVHAQL